MSQDPLIQTWAIHNRINLYMLDAIDAAAMDDAIEKSRSVRQLFVHMHAVRLMWLKASVPALLEGVPTLDAKDKPDRTAISAALKLSSQAIESLITQAIANDHKVKNFKPHVTAFVGYLISHESHHRGQAGWALKHAGHPLDKKTAFGLWAWGVR
jgi:uncharacterized damage-inducible protein DinB